MKSEYKVDDLILMKSGKSNCYDRLYRVTKVVDTGLGWDDYISGILIKELKEGIWVDTDKTKVQKINYWNGIPLTKENKEYLLLMYQNTIDMLENLLC